MQKFCHKVNKIVSEVEGRKVDSLSESLKWIKGLLSDFVQLRDKLTEKENTTSNQNFSSFSLSNTHL